MEFMNRDALKEFLKEHEVEDLLQLNQLVKQMTGMMIEEMLEAERYAHLGYS